MPRPCTICEHPDRALIDRALLTGSYASVADQFDVTGDSLRRHHANHMLPSMAASPAVREVAEAHHAGDLLGEVVKIKERAEVLLDKAEAQGDIPAATGALRELRRTVELLGKVTGELAVAGPQTINILSVDGWPEMRDAILSALLPHPEARQAVARVLRGQAAEVAP